MSVEQNKLIMYRMIEEVWNKGNYEVADELFTPGHTSPSAPDLPPGSEGVKMLARMFREAMPDFHMSIDMIMADENQVAARFIQSGTHTGGDLMGMEASGRRAEWTEIGVLQIEDGKISQSWYEVDMLSMIQQLNERPSIDEQKNILRRISEEVWGKGNYDYIYETFSPDLIDNSPLPGITPGREGYKQAAVVLLTAFPDLKINMLHQLAEGDMAVDHWEGNATHLDEFLGIPATGKKIKLAGFNLGRINPSGQISERWAQFNSLDLMQQLGAVPGGGDSQIPLSDIPAFSSSNGSMTAEEINTILHRYVEEIWNDGSLSAADEIIHPNAVTPYQSQLPAGPEGAKAFVSGFRSAFPDLNYEIEHRVTDGDLVAVRARITGTHDGDFLGIAPTGSPVTFEKMSVKQIMDGKIVVNWALPDMLALFQQITPDAG